MRLMTSPRISSALLSRTIDWSTVRKRDLGNHGVPRRIRDHQVIVAVAGVRVILELVPKECGIDDP